MLPVDFPRERDVTVFAPVRLRGSPRDVAVCGRGFLYRKRTGGSGRGLTRRLTRDGGLSGPRLLAFPLFLNPALFRELFLLGFAGVCIEIGFDVHVFERTGCDFAERGTGDRTAVITAPLRFIDADQQNKAGF